jgi:hypothetical protein
MKIFTDNSIIEQSQCSIGNGKEVCEGVSIMVKKPTTTCDAVEVLLKQDEIRKALELCVSGGFTEDELWGWFGLSYASFLVLPRVLIHEMPSEWQNRMTALLYEYDEMFPNQPELGTRVQATRDGKLTKWPPWLLNYRHPDHEEIEKLKSTDKKE